MLGHDGFLGSHTSSSGDERWGVGMAGHMREGTTTLGGGAPQHLLGTTRGGKNGGCGNEGGG